MPEFFRGALASFHQYRQNALLDATVALTCGASLTLTSIGRYLPGSAQAKNKIQRVDRLMGNTALHNDIPLILNNIISIETQRLSCCVIAVDWSGYSSLDYHVLRASMIYEGRSIPLLSMLVPYAKQQNAQAQKAFLSAIHDAIAPDQKVIIVTDAGFQNAWFRHIKCLGWDFIGRVRGNIQLRLKEKGEQWLRRQLLTAKSKPEYLGPGTLARAKYAQCDGHFYLHKKETKGR